MNCKNVIGAKIVRVEQQRDPLAHGTLTYSVDRIYLDNGYFIALLPYETDDAPGVEAKVYKTPKTSESAS